MSETLVVVGVRALGRIIALHFAAAEVAGGLRGAHAGGRRGGRGRVDGAGGRGRPVVCDLMDRASLAALVERPGGRPVVSAQTAGGRFGARPLLEIDDEELVSALDAYLRGTWNLLKTVGPRLLAQKRGTFLQIGTSSGCAHQGGVRRAGRRPARPARAGPGGGARVARHRVHVAYLPIDGGIESERTAAWIATNGPDRAVPPEEIARACEYLHRQDPRAWTHELSLRPPATDWTAPT